MNMELDLTIALTLDQMKVSTMEMQVFNIFRGYWGDNYEFKKSDKC